VKIWLAALSELNDKPDLIGVGQCINKFRRVPGTATDSDIHDGTSTKRKIEMTNNGLLPKTKRLNFGKDDDMKLFDSFTSINSIATPAAGNSGFHDPEVDLFDALPTVTPQAAGLALLRKLKDQMFEYVPGWPDNIDLSDFTVDKIGNSVGDAESFRHHHTSRRFKFDTFLNDFRAAITSLCSNYLVVLNAASIASKDGSWMPRIPLTVINYLMVHDANPQAFAEVDVETKIRNISRSVPEEVLEKIKDVVKPWMILQKAHSQISRL
jgi:hypothetical protein